VVVDNTSRFRYEDDIPLVVPEVNAAAIAQYTHRGIIANPNCSTIQMLVALKPIHDAVGIERINVSTYQAVSGTGKQAIEELAAQSAQLLSGKPVTPKVYPKQIAFNVLPQIDVFMDNGYTKEEMKMVWETRKIMGDDRIQVNPTTVRVPVFYGHSEAVHIETRDKITAERALELLRASARRHGAGRAQTWGIPNRRDRERREGPGLCRPCPRGYFPPAWSESVGGIRQHP
jgi:aspartate-semialdehyde dehydrogenase